METPGFVAPAYGARSLAEVLPAVATALGVDLGVRSPLSLPEAGRYVVLLVDGLGHELLSAHPGEAPYLHSLLGLSPASACVPSTTATSLASLGTGLPPGRHGVVGYTSRIPGTDRLLNALQWSKQVDPVEWQPHATVFNRLEAAGVRTTTVNRREYAASGLTLATLRGAEYVGADKTGERIVAAQHASRSVAGQPSLVYVYDGDLDWTGHRWGVDSAQWRAQLAMSDVLAQRLRDGLPTDTRLLVVADHGMVDATDPATRVDVDRHPALREGVALLGGEARFRHVYCRAGAVSDVRDAWAGVLADRAEVLTRGEALARGWFGVVEASVRPRLGDVVAACRGDAAVLSSVDFPYETTLVGLHGSLTRAEMLVPLLVD